MSAEDVQLGADGTTQDVEIVVDNGDNVLLDVSDTSSTVTEAAVASDSDVTGIATYDGSNNVEINPDGSGTITVEVIHNLEDVTTGSITYNVNEASDSFSLIIPSNRDELADGRTAVTNENAVFQGEENFKFVGDNGAVYRASELEGTAGNREGAPLQMPIATDEDTGSYDLNGPSDGTGGFSVNVVEPRITTAEVQQGDMDGSDISQVPSSSADNLFIVAEWNFGEAENLEVTVEDPTVYSHQQ